MKNNNKIICTLMIAVFTTIIVLSQLPASAVNNDIIVKSVVKYATYNVERAEKSVQTVNFNTSASQNLYNAGKKSVAEIKKFGSAYDSYYTALTDRLDKVISKIQCRIPETNITKIVTTNYSKDENWLTKPASIDKKVDVFYLYPTEWQKASKDEADICQIDNPMMHKYSKLVYERQATAFETVGNIYAPYYRQADPGILLTMTLKQQEELISGIPAADAIAAFDYYIKNYNNGRPFILAGHSQGSDILTYLLSDYMKKNPDVYKRMIAAYVIGYSITPEFLAQNPHLKFAQGPDDTGVIISYNTEAPNVVGNNPVLLPGALCINPINWSRDETLATAQENLGSLLFDPSGKIIARDVKNYADARINLATGALICSTADAAKLAPGNVVFGKGVFHSFDYTFYYNNLRQNAQNRVNKFLNK